MAVLIRQKQGTGQPDNPEQQRLVRVQKTDETRHIKLKQACDKLKQIKEMYQTRGLA